MTALAADILMQEGRFNWILIADCLKGLSCFPTELV